VEHYSGEAIACPVSIELLLAIPRSKTGRLETPVGDGDNYEKAVYDLLQSKGYLDYDRWIISGTWTKNFVPHGRPGYARLSVYPYLQEIEI
jgi:Holliday junction resolvase RusA-like endonuclease